MSRVEYQYRVFNQNWVELDTDIVLAAMRSGIKGLADYLDEVELVAFDTFSPSVVLMDAGGEALYPIITHLDRRSKDQMQRIVDEMGSRTFQGITGIQPFIGGASITTILWLMENEPALFDRTFKLGHFNTYIYHKLTGCWATDPVNASMTGMFETIAGDGWSGRICDSFGIPMNKLPDILQHGMTAGRLTEQAAAITGLRKGIPVALGSNDAATAQIGAGNVKAGDILNISGSSEMISILTDKAVASEHYYLRRAATPGLWQIFATTASGLAVDWFRKLFYQDMEERTFYQKELPDIIRREVDSTSVRFSPYIAGDRQSLAPKTGAFTGLTLQTGKRDFLAAILLGIHEPIVNTINIASGYLDLNKRIKLTGGMLDDAFIELKRKILKGYDFTVIDNCPIIGNGILATQPLKRPAGS